MVRLCQKTVTLSIVRLCEPGVFDGSVITFFNVRAQFSNRTRTVPRHMLQYGRNKQQQLRVIHIHERIYAGR